MSQNFDNRRRAFSDVVTIDAWHQTFAGELSKADLHADVVFGTARVGGEIESPIRFRLSVKRAEVVVVIPESEPVTVDKSTVSRDAPELQGRLTETLEQTTQANMKGNISGSLNAAGPSASASVSAGAETSVSANKKLEVSGIVQFMIVTQSKTADDYYRWTIEPRTKNALEGRPWDGLKQPRLKLSDLRKDRSKSIPPTVRVEVRCRREDLIIEDLEVKDQSTWQAVKARVGFKNRMAAAESYIRDRLADEGLDVRNISDIFGHLTLASAIAETI